MFMAAASSCKAVLAPSCTASTLHGATMTEHSKSGVKLIIPRNRDKYFAAKVRRLRTFRTAAAFEDFPAAADPGNVEVTWQIVVGALAGVTPFVVAGIEFSKRIIAQRRCEVCGGSGLVLREKYQFRCPGCGGFLPWQSWKRFFSG